MTDELIWEVYPNGGGFSTICRSERAQMTTKNPEILNIMDWITRKNAQPIYSIKEIEELMAQKDATFVGCVLDRRLHYKVKAK